MGICGGLTDTRSALSRDPFQSCLSPGISTCGLALSAPGLGADLLLSRLWLCREGFGGWFRWVSCRCAQRCLAAPSARGEDPENTCWPNEWWVTLDLGAWRKKPRSNYFQGFITSVSHSHSGKGQLCDIYSSVQQILLSICHGTILVPGGAEVSEIDHTHAPSLPWQRGDGQGTNPIQEMISAQKAGCVHYLSVLQ